MLDIHPGKLVGGVQVHFFEGNQGIGGCQYGKDAQSFPALSQPTMVDYLGNAHAGICWQKTLALVY